MSRTHFTVQDEDAVTSPWIICGPLRGRAVFFVLCWHWGHLSVLDKRLTTFSLSLGHAYKHKVPLHFLEGLHPFAHLVSTVVVIKRPLFDTHLFPLPHGVLFETLRPFRFWHSIHEPCPSFLRTAVVVTALRGTAGPRVAGVLALPADHRYLELPISFSLCVPHVSSMQ